MPGERIKRYGLALAALAQNDWSQAIAEFEWAFATGFRSGEMLHLYGLIDDQYGLYKGFSESVEWRAWLARLDAANAKDRTDLRARFPELFADLR